MRGLMLGLAAMTLLACKDDKDVGSDSSPDPVDDTGEPVVVDADGDGFDEDVDCDDDDASVNPDAVETCDGVDNDCDALIDDDDDSLSDASLWYTDGDGDGFGDPATELSACEAPSGAVDQGGDCDDTDAALHPDADELCDSIDNDCDELIDDADDDLTDAPTWFEDGDGDGYGDPTTARLACSAPSGSVDNDLDCDDSDININPDMDERCDGIDNDCNPDTSEAGWVEFHTDGGNESELTNQFAGATSANPYIFANTQSGVLYVCEGSYYARIQAGADLLILGVSGSDLTTLDGGQDGSVLSVTVGGVTVDASGLTLQNGVGTGNYLGQTMGGGVRCDGASDIVFDDIVVTGNSAGLGAGLFSRGCTLNLTDSVIESNTSSFFGGGAAIVSGDATFEDSLVQNNEADYGAGMLVGTVDSATVALINSSVSGNSATDFAGGIIIEDSSVSCVGSSSVTAGVWGNTAGSGGGGVWFSDSEATFDATDCDMGDGSDDNSPDDFASFDWSLDSYGDDVTVSCTGDGC